MYRKKLPAIIYFLVCFYIIIIVLTILDSCKKKDSVPGCAYATDIKPLVAARCALSGCHAPGSSQPDFTNFGTLKTYADNGMIRYHVFDLKIMPPANCAPLTQAEKDMLKCWLDKGAPGN